MCAGYKLISLADKRLLVILIYEYVCQPSLFCIPYVTFWQILQRALSLRF